MSNNDKVNDDDDDRSGEEKPRTWSRFALASRLRDLDRG